MSWPGAIKSGLSRPTSLGPALLNGDTVYLASKSEWRRIDARFEFNFSVTCVVKKTGMLTFEHVTKLSNLF